MSIVSEGQAHPVAYRLPGAPNLFYLCEPPPPQRQNEKIYDCIVMPYCDFIILYVDIIIN